VINIIRRVQELTVDSDRLPKILGPSFFPRQPTNMIWK